MQTQITHQMRYALDLCLYQITLKVLSDWQTSILLLFAPDEDADTQIVDGLCVSSITIFTTHVIISQKVYVFFLDGTKKVVV